MKIVISVRDLLLNKRRLINVYTVYGIHSIQHMRCVKPARYHIRETPRYFFVVSWPCMGIFKYINGGLSGESQTQFLYQML